MLSCKEVTPLASHSLDGELPWPVRWKMRVHLLVCYHCRRYVKQIRIVVNTVTRFARKEVSEEVVTQQVNTLINVANNL